MTHQVVWLPESNAPVQLGVAETPEPGPGELLVKVKVIAFNPIEAKLQRFELHPLKYPANLGLSFSGTVESVGPGVEGFAKGDDVASLRPEGKLTDSRFGSFQEYVLTSASTTAKLPSEKLLTNAASVVANLSTIVSALNVFLKLDKPAVTGQAPAKGKKVLVYGGSSQCGMLATTYLRSAGYDVITTSSLSNHHFVASLKPTMIIDHTRSRDEVINDLNSNGPYEAVFDTIGLPPVTEIIATYLSNIGGGSYSTLIPPLPGTKPLPENVQRNFESYGWVFDKPENEELRKWLYEELLPKGMESGVVATTPIERIQGGLGNVQHALDLLNEGKSTTPAESFSSQAMLNGAFKIYGGDDVAAGQGR